MKLLLVLLISYLLGSINPAYLIARARGLDIRRHGSGNAGASNALIVLGKRAALITALLDIFKAYLSVTLAVYFLPEHPSVGIVAAFGCTMGHIFPLFMGFRGGKGLACLGGLILALDYRLFLVMLGAELVLVLLVDYICVVPISASVALPIVYHVIWEDMLGTALLGLLAIVIVYKHMSNLKRIRQGTEAHFSYLWKRTQEEDRLRDRIDDPLLQERDKK